MAVLLLLLLPFFSQKKKEKLQKTRKTEKRNEREQTQRKRRRKDLLACLLLPAEVAHSQGSVCARRVNELAARISGKHAAVARKGEEKLK